MFPLNDFNFVACAIATFSAAVGYKYTKRRAERRANLARASSDIGSKLHLRKREGSLSSVSSDTPTLVDSDESFASDCPTPSDSGIDTTEPGSLKRKTRDEDPNDSTSTKSQRTDEARRSTSPPRKRSRSTPPADESYECHSIKVKEVQGVVVASAPQSLTLASGQASTLHAAFPPDIGSQDDQTPTAPANPKPIASAFTIPVCKPSTAFSAFAGVPSGLASATYVTNNPVWRANNAEGADGTRVSTRTGDKSSGGSVDCADSASTPAESSVLSERPPGPVENPFAAPTATLAVSTQQALTGEEDENVQSELKGVKVFIKRGDKEFSSGILGHVKLLVHRETSDERLVFRRELVWKVSMSVRLRPEVHCSFDEDQAILRLVQKEAAGPDSASEQVVVYALKRGKVAKADFSDFARSIVSSARLLGNSPLDPSFE